MKNRKNKNTIYYMFICIINLYIYIYICLFIYICLYIILYMSTTWRMLRWYPILCYNSTIFACLLLILSAKIESFTAKELLEMLVSCITAVSKRFEFPGP